jgi:hypothetical protein
MYREEFGEPENQHRSIKHTIWNVPSTTHEECLPAIGKAGRIFLFIYGEDFQLGAV